MVKQFLTYFMLLVVTANAFPQVMGSDNGYSKSYGPLLDLEYPILPGGDEAVLEHFVYPEAARKEGIQGTLEMEFVVDVTGRVWEARAIIGPEALMRAAEDAVEKTSWIPAKIHGQAVNITVRYFLHVSPELVKEKPPMKPEGVGDVCFVHLLFGTLATTMFYLLHTL